MQKMYGRVGLNALMLMAIVGSTKQLGGMGPWGTPVQYNLIKMQHNTIQSYPIPHSYPQSYQIP